PYTDNTDLHSFPTRRSSDLNYHEASGIAKKQDSGRAEIPDSKCQRCSKPQTPIIKFPGATCAFENWNLDFGISLQHLIALPVARDRKSTRLNSSHLVISYAV